MAEIKFFANIVAEHSAKLINHTAGSGLGFYGTDHGVSVPIGTQQSTTFVTDANGTNKGAAVPNTQYANTDDNRILNPGKVVADSHGASALNLDALPNYAAPLNIRFTHGSVVKCQNAKLRVFDRSLNVWLISSQNFKGLIFFFSAALCIFKPCSSVPVKK